MDEKDHKEKDSAFQGVRGAVTGDLEDDRSDNASKKDQRLEKVSMASLKFPVLARLKFPLVAK
jgi:hypothetical protein